MSAQIPTTPDRQTIPCDVDLDFLRQARELDPFAHLGGYPPPKPKSSPSGLRLRAISIPSISIITLDHLFGADTAIEHLVARFELKPVARLEESQAEDRLVLLVEEGDYKRLGAVRFERELGQALQAIISEIPTADAERATDEAVLLALIEAGVVGRDHAEKLGDKKLEDLLSMDLGL
jgi:hypothetical protein